MKIKIKYTTESKCIQSNAINANFYNKLCSI